MSKIERTIVKRTLPVIYAIDVSGSMKNDGKIATVNEAMHECEEILKEKAGESADAELKIAALKFSSGAQWVTKSGLVSLEDFYWNDVQADGVTDLGAALKALEAKLHRTGDGFLDSEVGFFLPVIIFMSDGGPTDDWEKSLKLVKKNQWFDKARKIAIAIGDDADVDVLKELVGNSESVVRAKSLETLKSLIIEVSVSASMMAGQSTFVGDEAKGEDILNVALTKVEGDAEVEATPVTTPTAPTDTDDTDSDDDWGGDDDWN